MARTRVLVVSDTHGKADLQAIATLARGADLLVHLGDGFADGQRLAAMQATPVVQVTGNHDAPLTLVPEKVIHLHGWPILLVHGHLHGVKQGPGRLARHAHEQDCRLALHGHLHRRLHDTSGPVPVICPSSPSYTYDGLPPAVGWLEVTSEAYEVRWIEVKPRAASGGLAPGV